MIGELLTVVGINVPIDSFVTGQSGATGNLFRTEVLIQQDLHLGDASASMCGRWLACARRRSLMRCA
ncbi:pyrroline-5-carboxylate reductase [Xanthomonas fragariae]|nr:pyrroline-5-carboxylate reductase [Xanthomonas fragariae]